MKEDYYAIILCRLSLLLIILLQRLDLIFTSPWYFGNSFEIWLHVGAYCARNIVYFLPWRKCPQWATPPRFRGFTITLGRTPLDEWSARPRDLYLTTHNRQTSMAPAGFEPTISRSERPQTHASDRAAIGAGTHTLHDGLSLLFVQPQQVTRS